MTAQGLTKLHIVPQGVSVNGQYYRDHILPIYEEAWNRAGPVADDVIITEKVLITSRGSARFQQDGATPQTANITQDLVQEVFGDNKVWLKDDWPGSSPDLNMIETLWAILKDAVYQDPQARTLDELRRRVRREWKRIPQDLLQKLAESFKKRVEGVIASEGRKIVG